MFPLKCNLQFSFVVWESICSRPGWLTHFIYCIANFFFTYRLTQNNYGQIKSSQLNSMVSSFYFVLHTRKCDVCLCLPVEAFVHWQVKVLLDGSRHARPHGGSQLLVAPHGPFPWRYVDGYILLPSLLLLCFLIQYLFYDWKHAGGEKQGDLMQNLNRKKHWKKRIIIFDPTFFFCYIRLWWDRRGAHQHVLEILLEDKKKENHYSAP